MSLCKVFFFFLLRGISKPESFLFQRKGSLRWEKCLHLQPLGRLCQEDGLILCIGSTGHRVTYYFFLKNQNIHPWWKRPCLLSTIWEADLLFCMFYLFVCLCMWLCACHGDVCVYVCDCVHAMMMWGNQRSTCRSLFSPSTMWVPETELRSSGWVAGTFICWANLIALGGAFYIYLIFIDFTVKEGQEKVKKTKASGAREMTACLRQVEFGSQLPNKMAVNHL